MNRTESIIYSVRFSLIRLRSWVGFALPETESKLRARPAACFQRTSNCHVAGRSNTLAILPRSPLASRNLFPPRPDSSSSSSILSPNPNSPQHSLLPLLSFDRDEHLEIDCPAPRRRLLLHLLLPRLRPPRARTLRPKP